MIHKREFGRSAARIIPRKKKTTATCIAKYKATTTHHVLESPLRKLRRYHGSSALLEVSKDCFPPRSARDQVPYTRVTARSCARSVSSPPYTVLRSLAEKKVKGSKRCCCNMSVAKPQPGGRSPSSVAMAQPAQYPCSPSLAVTSGLIYTNSTTEERQSPLSESDIALLRNAPV